MAKVQIGLNRFYRWMKYGEYKIVLDTGETTYAQRFMMTFLKFYVPIDAVEQGHRKTFNIDGEELEEALAIYRKMVKFDLSRFKGFRTEFKQISSNSFDNAKDYLKKVGELVDRYVAIRLLKTLK